MEPSAAGWGWREQCLPARGSPRTDCQDGSGGRGQEGASIDPGLVAVAVALTQCPPGVQLLRAHPPPVIQVVNVAVEHRLSTGTEELYGQHLAPGEGGEWVGLP